MFAAKAAGLPMEKVKLNTLVSGGSFGRRANSWSDFTVAAVNVAKAIGGRAPVRVQFTREDDTGAGLYRPMYVHAVKAGLDSKGNIAVWEHTIVGQSIMAGGPMAMMIKDGIDPTSVEGVDKSAYDLPMLAGSLHSPVLSVRPLWWRSVGNTHTAYVMETMIDELAAAAGRDPVAFRLALLDKAARGRCAQAGGGKSRLGRATAPGVAQGIAVHNHLIRSSRRSPKYRCARGKLRSSAWCAPSIAASPVNPDIIRAQMEGGIGFALGALYYGESRSRTGARRTQFRHLPLAAHPRDARGRGAHRQSNGSRAAWVNRASRHSRPPWPMRLPSWGAACAPVAAVARWIGRNLSGVTRSVVSYRLLS